MLSIGPYIRPPTCFHQVIALLILFDGIQTIASGVVQALGCQHRGAVINGVAFYCFGVPLGLFLAFHVDMGAVGLYLGMVLGPVIQAVSYGAMLSRTNWEDQAR